MRPGLRLLCVSAFAAAVLSGACATGSARDRDGGEIPDLDGDPGSDGSGDRADAREGEGPTSIASFMPASLTVPRGGMGTLTVTLDAPAGTGGVAIALDSDDDSGAVLTLPSSLVVAEGDLSGSVTVEGVGVGGPVDVRATFGSNSETASVRVVPPLGGLTGPTGELVVGAAAVFTVSLETATPEPVAITITSTEPSIATVPAAVTVPAGASTASFNVTGAGLGKTTIVAHVGDATASAPVKVGGVVLSEILYDLSGDDEQKEWVEIYNRGAVAVDLTGVRIQINNGSSGGYVDSLILSGVIGAGGCKVVGGPLAGPTAGNFTPAGFTYLVTGDFTPSLGNAGSTSAEAGDAIALVTSAGTMVDVVLYGNNNGDGITNADGVAFPAPHVADVAPGRSIERTGPLPGTTWRVQTAPVPGTCAF